MPDSSILNKLIRSLNKSEKGFFVKHSKRHKSENNLYLKLFYYYSRENTDEKLLKHFPKNFLKRDLPVAKHYLYKNILNSLNLFNSANSIDTRIASGLNNISVLFEKSLFNESHKELKKLKKTCYRHEQIHYIFEILRLEKYVLSKIASAGLSESLSKLYDEEQEIISIIQNISMYRKLYIEISLLLREKGPVRNKREEKRFLKILQSPYLKNISEATSTESTVLFHHIHLIYYLSISDDKNVNLTAAKLVSAISSFEENIRRYMKDYVFGLTALLTSYFDLHDYEKTFETIKLMRSLKTNSTDEQQYIFLNTYSIELSIYISTGEFDNGFLLADEIEKGLNKYSKESISMSEIILYFNAAYACFGNEQYVKALIWINKILNLDLSMRTDVYSLAHILNLILHYELSNLDLLEYAIKNTYRYLYKREKLYKTEAAILKFLKKLTTVTNERMLLEEMGTLHAALLKLLNDPYEKIALDYFDIISWLESKIRKKKFSQIIKDKFRKERINH